MSLKVSMIVLRRCRCYSRRCRCEGPIPGADCRLCGVLCTPVVRCAYVCEEAV